MNSTYLIIIMNEIEKFKKKKIPKYHFYFIVKLKKKLIYTYFFMNLVIQKLTNNGML